MQFETHAARYREALSRLEPAGPPAVRLLVGDCPRRSRLAVMSGSFNPPTLAHLGLALAALATGEFDRLLFALAVRTINKEHVVGATLEERCCMLEALVEQEPRFGVIAVNRGLYLDQAIAVHAAFAPDDLAFVVGFDKIVQIVDPHYYTDRDLALHELFARARFFVAPRDGAGATDLGRLFAQPESRAYADRVRFLALSRLAEHEQALSSTLTRRLLAQGEDVSWAVPPAVLPVLDHIAGYRNA